MTAPANDAALIAAWNRFRVARATYSVLPHDTPMAPGTNDTMLEREQLDIIEPAEKFIGEAVPTTIYGAEIKLWFALTQDIDHSEQDVIAALRESYHWFSGDAHELGWANKQVFGALQALNAIRKKGGAASWDRLRQTYEATKKNLPEEPTDTELDQYYADWRAAMLGEADSLDAMRWKINEFVKGAEDGAFREDLHEDYLSAILADAVRFAARGVA